MSDDRVVSLGAKDHVEKSTFEHPGNNAAVISRIAHQTCTEAPPVRLDSERHWWQALEGEFHKQPEGFRLATRDNLQVRTTALFDIGLRTLAATMVGVTAGPTGFNPRKLRRALEQSAFYEGLAASGDPSAFFATPPSNVPIRTRKVRLPTYRPPRGVCEDLVFDSPYIPALPEARAEYLRHRNNATAHARLWRHKDRLPGGQSRPTIITIHGFGADNFLINHIIFALPWFYERLGCDVMMFTLPFHGRRQTRWSPFSGHGFFAGGLGRINEAFGQAVCDLRVLIDWFERRRGIDSVGVTGLSLGGLTTSLLASTEPRLKFAIPNVPVVSLADLVLEWHPLSAMVRMGLAVLRRKIADGRAMLAVSSPLSYRPAIAKERLMIVGGVGDRLAPPKHARILWEHWDRPRLHWFPGSHVIHLDQGAYLRQIARFLSELDFLPPRR